MKVLAGDQKVEGGSSWGIYSPGVPTAWLGAGGDCVVLPEARALGGPLNRSLCFPNHSVLFLLQI